MDEYGVQLPHLAPVKTLVKLALPSDRNGKSDDENSINL
jgi:hypothetical protein